MKKTRLANWLDNLPIQDPVNRRAASLLQIILLGLIAIFGIATTLNLLISPAAIPPQSHLLRGALFISVIGIPLILLRRGYFYGSIIIIVGLFLTLETYAILAANLRSIAETLTFLTLAILMAGLLVGRRALLLTFLLSAGVVIMGALREPDVELKLDSSVIAGNFILLNGLMSLFIDRFGIVLREALRAALSRESELKQEIEARIQTEAALKYSTERLEILHEIDRSLLSAQSPKVIAKDALIRIRQLIPCLRASTTLFDFDTLQATFLAADFDGMVNIPDTPIPMEEYGMDAISVLQQNQPWFTGGIMHEPHVTDLAGRLAIERGIHSRLSLPLLYQGQLIGAINLGRGPGEAFNSQDAQIAHDVANQLSIALQQGRLVNALQAELAERKKLIAELEASNAELERFTYTVSHDLRNPLVTIKGFLGMLEKDIRERQTEKIQNDLDRIAGAANKMNELLSDLLELSRIGRILNPPEEIDLGELAQDAVESLDARLRSRPVAVVISPDLPAVVGDRIRLREVLENLIDNAAKYMGEQPGPRIEIGVRNHENMPILFVRDNGIGIEQQYQSKIFTLFEKLDPTIEGTGIGLALVKRIIETHGGRIWVESDGSGKGSTFCFTIPSSSRTPQSLQPAPKF